MLILNSIIILIFIVCVAVYPKAEQYRLVPQLIAILLVLNKDVIIRKIGLNIRFIPINKPILASDRTMVTIHCRLSPKGDQDIYLSDLRLAAKGYIRQVEFPPGEVINSTKKLYLEASGSNEIVLRINSYPGRKLSRFLTLKYSINSIPKDKLFILRTAKH